MLVDRKDILSQYKIIASEITKLQQAFYSDEDLDLFEKTGEKEMYLQQFDMMGMPKLEIKIFEKVLGFKQKENINDFTKQLSQKLFELLTELKVEELFLLTPKKYDLFEDNFKHLPEIKKHYESLSKLIGRNTYDEAFQIELNQLDDFVEVFFWLARSGRVEYVSFFDMEERLVFEICKRGNIHFTEFEKEQLKDCDSFSKDWVELKACEEDNFIEGD